MSEIRQDYDFYTYIDGSWQKLNSDCEVLADTVKYKLEISQSNIENAGKLIDFYGEINEYLSSISNEDYGNILLEIENMDDYENINIYLNNLDNTINSDIIDLFTSINDLIENLVNILEETPIDNDLAEGNVEEIIGLTTSVLGLEEEDFYNYENLDALLQEEFNNINYSLDNKYNKNEVNNLLNLKANTIDTYLLNDLMTYINNLNLSNNFPNTNILTLPSDKTLWEWLFNAILLELRDKVTSDDLEDLLSVSERRYYANSKNNLPTTGDSSVLYFVLTDSTSNINQYEEYVWVDNHYELLGAGSTNIDLTNYYNKTEIDSMIGDLQDYLNS